MAGNAIVHFEIHADDVDRAKQFYETVFGWSIEQWKGQGYWIVRTGRSNYPDGGSVGIDGGMLKRKGAAPFEAAPVNAFVCTMTVADIDATLKQVTQAGGKIVVPKAKLEDMGWNAYCKDTEGNTFGLIQTTM